MSEPTTELQFDHATYEQAKTGVMCGMCGKPVGHEYWQWMGRVVCARCRDQVYALGAKANAPATFAKAAVLATGTALGCGVAYALFVAATKSRWALITIGIAYVIATVIRKSTHNISGRRYQVLAVILTYAASTMGYVPLFTGSLAALSASQAVTLAGYMLAAPFLTATDSPLGLVIVGIGLWEAWRRAKGLPMAVTGPFRVAPSGQVPAP
jgi:hypothetical protein